MGRRSSTQSDEFESLPLVNGDALYSEQQTGQYEYGVHTDNPQFDGGYSLNQPIAPNHWQEHRDAHLSWSIPSFLLLAVPALVIGVLFVALAAGAPFSLFGLGVAALGAVTLGGIAAGLLAVAAVVTVVCSLLWSQLSREPKDFANNHQSDYGGYASFSATVSDDVPTTLSDFGGDDPTCDPATSSLEPSTFDSRTFVHGDSTRAWQVQQGAVMKSMSPEEIDELLRRDGNRSGLPSYD